jgi:hypothetical protein
VTDGLQTGLLHFSASAATAALMQDAHDWGNLASTRTTALIVEHHTYIKALLSSAACRKPWEHVIAGTATAYLFQWIVDQEESLVKQIEDHYSRMTEQKQ